MIFRDIARQIHPQRVINKVVFDLDQLLRRPGDLGGAPDNGLLAVAKEQLKLGHARKHSNSRFIHRINACLIFSLIFQCVNQSSLNLNFQDTRCNSPSPDHHGSPLKSV